MEGLVESLAWDSEHFGFPVGRVVEPSADRLGAAAKAADRAGVHCLTALVQAGSAAAITAAEDAGFRCYDVRVELARAVRPELLGEEAGRASESEQASLEQIAANSFLDSRFYADEHFPRAAVEELYRAWLRRGFAGDGRLVLTAPDRDGFVVCHLDERAGAGTVELIAVAPRSRGRGIGGQLVRGAEAVFAGAGLGRARVVTQGSNLPAQRLYQREGYRSDDVSLWFHRWAVS